MLKNIDPLLTGRLLQLLDEMGHGDVLGLVDRNFPAHRYQVPVVPLRGADTAAVATALLSVFPLDSYGGDPIQRMQIDNSPDEISTATDALGAAVSAAEDRTIDIAGVERFAFYQEATRAMLMIQTGETVPYSCYLLRKGVV